MWIWPQVASCDLRLHVGLHFCCNERLMHLWHSEQKQQLHLRSNERPRKLWRAEPKQRRTEATEHRPHEARKQRPGARKKRRKEDSELLIYTQKKTKCFQSSFRGASKVPSTAQVPLEASRAASERSPGGSWDLPGRPRERLGELRERLGDHVGRIWELRGGGLS